MRLRLAGLLERLLRPRPRDRLRLREGVRWRRPGLRLRERLLGDGLRLLLRPPPPPRPLDRLLELERRLLSLSRLRLRDLGLRSRRRPRLRDLLRLGLRLRRLRTRRGGLRDREREGERERLLPALLPIESRRDDDDERADEGRTGWLR